jgi:mRNA-degrading endonuclease toxin of MazEF toxin-antitoxin module
MPASYVVNLDNILTIPKQNLDRSLTSLTPEKLALVEQAIRFALELH